jgi:selenocysteine-specific elongation factor
VHVRGLQSLGRPVGDVRGVARIAVNLRGVPREAAARGDALLTPDAWLAPAEFDVALRGVRGTEPASLPRAAMLHVGSAAVAVHVRPLGPGFARLRPDRPLPLRIGDRAVLRDPGRRAVVAGIEVLDVLPPALRRRGAAARRAAELAEPDVGTAAGELRRRGTVRIADLAAMGVARAEVDAVGADGWLVAPWRAKEAVDTLAAAVRAHDAAEPLDPGLTTEAARRAADLPTPGLVAAVLAAAGTGTLQLRDGRVHLGRARGLPEPVRVALEKLRADLTASPFRAPEANRLTELGLGPRELAALVRAGELIAITDGVVLLPDAPDRAVDLLRGVGPTFTLSEARRALGTTRRVAVPLLEHLARTGRSVREDDLTHRLR